MPERYPGIDDRQEYSEGILVGYRWYDTRTVAPLFPFGHGLSYTTFRYSGLRVARAGDGHDVSFVVRNVGSRRGAEVPQLYLGAPARPPVEMAAQSLAGFQRVELAPGASRRVVMRVTPRQLSWWSAERHEWVEARGHHAVTVGSSSRDVRLRGSLTH